MRTCLLSLALLAAFVLAAAPASAVTIDWVTVGDPGNAGDPQESCSGCGPGTSFGSVAYVYRIGKYEVTNAQYAEFLNTVAATDTNGLYNVNMDSSPHGGITQSGSSGSFFYTVKSGMGSRPVNHVSFYDSLRFANWLHNGQPTGGQGNSTTEDGAYTITALGISNNSITRNAGATIFLPSEDEWYKAAYYDVVSASYFDYPAGSDTQTTCAAPGATANTANCTPGGPGTFTDVGFYTGSASPNGTFDQGGNSFEWNEWDMTTITRGYRGGGFTNNQDTLGAARRSDQHPSVGGGDIGFRVAMIPEPTTALLLATGLVGLAVRRRGLG